MGSGTTRINLDDEDDADAAPRLAVQTGDALAPLDGPVFPIVLVLDHLRSAFNVGNIFRLAELCRIEAIVTCGYTATPPHPKLVKTARGCDALVSYRHAATSAEAVRDLKEQGYYTLAIETVAGAPDARDAPLRFPLALVLGNEANGVAPECLAICDGVARLPVYGRKNSLNVSNCAAVVLYDAVRRCPSPTA